MHLTVLPIDSSKWFPPVGSGGGTSNRRLRWQLGSGLPASLSVDRVKEVLDLTRRDERLFQDRLDERGGFFWASTGVGQDFHERLRELLRTAGGRAEYDSARQDLRRRNAKTFGKLDFGFRLLSRCLRDIGREPDGTILEDKGFDAALEEFEDEERLDLKAQFLWGSALAASEERPSAVGALISLAPEEEIREVREGLVPVGGTVEAAEVTADIEPEQLMDRFRSAVRDLRIGEAGLDRFLRLQSDLDRIVAMVEDREAERGEFLRLFDQFVEQYRNAEFLIPLVDRCIHVVSEWRSSRHTASPRTVERALSLAALLFAAERAIRSARKLVEQAVADEDYARLGVLSGDMEKLAGERDRNARELAECMEDWPDDPPGTGGSPDGGSGGGSGGTEGPAAGGRDGGPVEPGSGIAALGAVGETGPVAGAELDAVAPSLGRDSASGSAESLHASEGNGEFGPSAVPTRPTVDAVETAIARAIRDRRWGVAHQLALKKRKSLPGSGAIRLIASNLVSDPDDAIEADLPGIAAEALDFFESRVASAAARRRKPERRAVAILLASSALLPALRAPGGPVVELLARLDSHLEDCPALRALARASVETLASTDMPLTPESLARDWDTQLAELGEDSARWIEGERSAKLAYAPATDLWHSLLESWNENGRSSIGEMFGLMVEPAKPSRIVRAQRIADFWRENTDREIDRLRQARHGNAHTRIDGRARIRLREKIAEAAAHADRLTECLAAKPSGAERYQQPIARAVRAAAEANGADAVREASRLGGPYVACSQALLEAYLRAVHGEGPVASVPGLRLRDLLEGEFLCWIELAERPAQKQLIAMLDAPVPDMAEVVKQCIGAGEFDRAEATLDYAHRRDALVEADRASLTCVLEKRRVAAAQEFDRRFEEIEGHIQSSEEHQAFNSDLGEQLRAALLASLEPGDGDHRGRMIILDKAQSDLDKAVSRCRREIRKAFRAVKHPPARIAHQFEKAVKESRFRDARELLGRLQQQAETG